MNKYISVGKILNFHGVRGEAKVGYSKGQQDFLNTLESVYVQINNEYKELFIESVRFNNKFALIKFKGINTVNDIVLYKSCLLFVKEETIRENLDEDEFLKGEWFDLETAIQMIYSGEIKDAKTIIAILSQIK